jgi:hypothetical protein
MVTASHISHQPRKASPKILRQARAISKHYRIILKGRTGKYEGRGVEIAHVRGRGRTATECFKNTRDALAAVVVECLRRKQIPPVSWSQSERTKRVRIYVTSEERLILEEKARQFGAVNVEEYLRAVALTI